MLRKNEAVELKVDAREEQKHDARTKNSVSNGNAAQKWLTALDALTKC